MKKNGQYVGVDEKYIPEDEKYVDNNLNGEIKKDMEDIYHGAKEYVSDKDNQEKMKKVGKKGLKIAKGIGIGYLVFVGTVIVMVIAIFILVFSQLFKTNKQDDEVRDKVTNIIDHGAEIRDKESSIIDNDDEIMDKATNIIDHSGEIGDEEPSIIDDAQNKTNVDDFNFNIESYSGVQYGSAVSILLDNIISKIKKNADHLITVTYGATTTFKVDEITTLKKQFDRISQYEVSLDYDSNGYINKVTIANY